jgi:hypothetical protein
MVKTHLFPWKRHLSDSKNEDRLLSKIVNMKKKFFGEYTSTTSKEANKTKPQREQADAKAVRDGVAEDYDVANAFVANQLADFEEDYETCRAATRENHQLRARAINSSTLGVRVFLWEDAEVVAASLVETIFSFVGRSEKNF